MPDDPLPILAALFLLVGALYSSVGHAGASGYLAVMALLGIQAAVMRPTALVINVAVAAIAFVQFARAGHFRWRLFLPFALTSVPLAFLGGRIQLPGHALHPAIGAVLLFSTAWMIWTGLRPPASLAPPRSPPLAAALLCGGILGLVAGLTGTGGGIFLSPLLLMLNWADTRRTAAVSSLFILVNSLAGLAGLASDGWTPPHGLTWLVAAAALGGLIGSQLGSRILDQRALRLLLAVVLAIAGAKLILK
ncbi:hypothetical protein PHYC_01965 [Phycisphaerales bacterium]|nr:hypothetical protein PHYC_01965 [Phycisphaerales bacterium]